MLTKEAINFFGSVSALAAALKIKPQAIYQWGARVPKGRAFELELMTAGALKAGEQTDAAPSAEVRCAT